MRIVTILLFTFVGLIAWQHFRYLRIRRYITQDQQPMVYASETFHAVTFLEVPADANLYQKIGSLKTALEFSDEAKVVYAGKAALVPLESSQLLPASWNAVILVSYPSQQIYETISKDTKTQRALASFSRHYTHGMKRPALANLALPQILLGLRGLDILKGNWRVDQFEPMPTPEGSEQEAALLRSRLEKLLELKDVNDQAVLVFNLVLHGDRQQQEANRSYGGKMLARMAALAHGPMHLGSGVTVEGKARFEEIVIVYYPGVDYFTQMVRSQFFQTIVGDKQLGDTMAVPTVPILNQLT